MPEFTAAELEVMQVLWQHGSLKPAEIQAHFPREIQNAALRSTLLILLEKGHVRRRKSGKAFYYSAATGSQSTLKKMARKMAATFCGGSTTALIATLLKIEKLNPEDIAELQRIARGNPDENTKEPEA